MDQRMPTDHDPGAAILLEAAHRTELCFQAAMIGLDAVVGVPIRAMPRRRQQLLPPDRVGRCPVGDDLDRLGTGRGDGPPKEAASGHPIASWGDELGWEAEAGESGPNDGSRAKTASSHSGSLAAQATVTANATVPSRVR